MISIPSAPRRPVVLITGASAGIGLALAQHLLSAGTFHLILTARGSSLSRFEAAGIVESAKVWLRPLDVTRGDQRGAIIAEANARLGGVDVLVNNAGIAYRSVLEHVNDEDWLAQMRVNFRAPMELARLVLPAMRARRSGRIIAVSSVGGMMAMPTMALYSASKFALEGAFEALWYEVHAWGIHVTLVQPGFVRSESFRNTRFTPQSVHGRDAAEDPYHAQYVHMGEFITRWMERSWSSPEDVARVITRIIRRRHPPLRVSGTPDARIFAMLRRLLPRFFYHRLLYACLPQVRAWGGSLERVNGVEGDAAINDGGSEARSSTPARR